MTEKRFTIDKDGRTILDSIDDSYCECGESYEAKQYCDKLNELAEENDKLKQEIKGFESWGHNWGLLYDETKNKVEELSKENMELKIKNDLLSDELEQAKAVINKKWDEYLKKKELSE